MLYIINYILFIFIGDSAYDSENKDTSCHNSQSSRKPTLKLDKEFLKSSFAKKAKSESHLYKFKSDMKHRFTDTFELQKTDTEIADNKTPKKSHVMGLKNQQDENKQAETSLNLNDCMEVGNISNLFWNVLGGKPKDLQLNVSGFILSHCGNFYNPFVVSNIRPTIDFQTFHRISCLRPHILYPVSICANFPSPPIEQIPYAIRENLEAEVNSEKSLDIIQHPRPQKQSTELEKKETMKNIASQNVIKAHDDYSLSHFSSQPEEQETIVMTNLTVNTEN